MFLNSVNIASLEPTDSPDVLFIPTKVIRLDVVTKVLGSRALSLSIDTSDPVSIRN